MNGENADSGHNRSGIIGSGSQPFQPHDPILTRPLNRESRLVRVIGLLYNAGHAPLESHPPVHPFPLCHPYFQNGGRFCLVFHFILEQRDLPAPATAGERRRLGSGSGSGVVENGDSGSYKTDGSHRRLRGRQIVSTRLIQFAGHEQPLGSGDHRLGRRI